MLCNNPGGGWLEGSIRPTLQRKSRLFTVRTGTVKISSVIGHVSQASVRISFELKPQAGLLGHRGSSSLLEEVPVQGLKIFWTNDVLPSAWILREMWDRNQWLFGRSSLCVCVCSGTTLEEKRNATFELFSPRKHANLRSRSMLLEDGDDEHLLLSFVLNKFEKTSRALSVNPKCDVYRPRPTCFTFFFYAAEVRWQ